MSRPTATFTFKPGVVFECVREGTGFRILRWGIGEPTIDLSRYYAKLDQDMLQYMDRLDSNTELEILKGGS